MRNLIIKLFVLLLCTAHQKVHASDFTIKNFDVSIDISENGSFRVTETIDVYFHESRRGIIRSIPYIYNQGEIDTDFIAQNRSQRGIFQIYIRDIRVSGHEFLILEENGNCNIRIGSADKYLKGDMQYVISYTVWGALNDFGRHAEFFWNLTGNDWECNIENCSFQIQTKPRHKFSVKDIVFYTGKHGSKDANVSWQITDDGVKGHATKILSAYEGITMALKLPVAYFKTFEIPLKETADKYFIESLDVKMNLRSDGNVDITEKYAIELLKSDSVFYRYFEKNNLKCPGDNPSSGLYLPILNAYYNDERKISDVSRKKFGSMPYLGFNFRSDTSGKIIFSLKYTVNGAWCSNRHSDIFTWNLSGYMQKEPVGKILVSISADSSFNLKPADISFFNNNGIIDKAVVKSVSAGNFTLQHPLAENGSDVVFMVVRKTPPFSPALIKHAAGSAEAFFVNDLITDITFNADGTVGFREEHHVIFPYPGGTFTTHIRQLYVSGKKNHTGAEIPSWALFGNSHKILIRDLSLRGNYYRYRSEDGRGYDYSWNTNGANDDTLSCISEYTILGLLQKKDKYFHFCLPVTNTFSEPTQNVRLRVYFPAAFIPSAEDVEISLRDGSGYNRVLTPVYTKNYLLVELQGGLEKYQYLHAQIRLPKDIISISSTDTFRLISLNNKPLIFPLFFLIVLLLAWFIAGRERKVPVVVRYLPPEGITPAEAGWLWDYKIHKRDLVSLIYYWAGKGLLRIIETESSGNSDYEFIKISNLPPEAKSHERIIFSALFAGRDSVKLSSLKNSFYHTLNLANKELQKQETGNFFGPGSRGFARMLRIAGYLVMAAGFFAVVSTRHNALQLTVSFAGLSFLFIFFSYIMPRRAPFGSEQYAALKGFREFMKVAGRDEIENLLRDKPDYLGRTIAFAIVLGMGEKWAEKFKGLMQEGPPWYSNSSGAAFDAVLFSALIYRSMQQMEKTMSSTPQASAGKSSYSSSSRSNRSSYRSSWGSSGGSGFRGGSSGGGFGGGGGKSW